MENQTFKDENDYPTIAAMAAIGGPGMGFGYAMGDAIFNAFRRGREAREERIRLENESLKPMPPIEVKQVGPQLTKEELLNLTPKQMKARFREQAKANGSRFWG
jgi:hypothetical protein